MSQTETAATERSRRKVRTGVVVSDAMDKTVVVRINSQIRHPMYGKIVRRTTKLKAHDEANDVATWATGFASSRRARCRRRSAGAWSRSSSGRSSPRNGGTE